MGIFEALPKIRRCCFCTRNLKVACILIDIWSMWVGCHSIGIVSFPACRDIFKVHGPLGIFKWLLFAVSMILLISSFAYLLGIFMSIRKTADAFIICGILHMVISLVYSVMYVVQMITVKCSNPSDVLAFILYSGLWVYYILIVNSYISEM